MKPKVLFATTLLLFVSIIAVGQDRILYHENNFERTFTKCQKPPMFGADSSDMQKYLADKLKAKIKKIEGSIAISVLIDTTGKPLCEWIENSSNLNVDRVKLYEIIDQMPNWHCGLQNGHTVDCGQLIKLTFNKQDLQVVYTIAAK